MFDVLTRSIADIADIQFEEQIKIEAALVAFSPLREACREVAQTDTTLAKALRIYLQLILCVTDRDLKMFLVDRMFRLQRGVLLECVFVSPVVDWSALQQEKITSYIGEQFKKQTKLDDCTESERCARNAEITMWMSCDIQRSAKENHHSLSSFWGCGVSIVTPWLHNQAQRLIDVRATNAVGERYFAAQSLMHSRLRSQLNDENMRAESTIRFRDLQGFVEEPIEEDEDDDDGENAQCTAEIEKSVGKLEKELSKRGRATLGWDNADEKLSDCVNADEARLFYEIHSVASQWDCLCVGDTVTITFDKGVAERERDVVGKVVKKNTKSVPQSFTYVVGDEECTLVPAFLDTPWALANSTE